MVPISAAMAADAAGDHEAGQHRCQLARHRQHDDGGDRALGREAGEAGIALQRQHHAREQRRQRHHRQREIADLDHLAENQARIEGRAHHVAQRQAGEDHQPAQRRQSVEKGAADRSESADHAPLPR
jgi:hypothetical protein